MLELRDYANKGGKLIVAGRNVHQAPDLDEHQPDGHRPVHVDAGQAVRLLLPGQQRGDDDLPGTACLRSRTHSNDTWQNYLGRRRPPGGIGTTRQTPPTRRWPARRSRRRPRACSPAWRRSRVDSTRGQRPEPERRRHAVPLAKIPLRLRNWAAGGDQRAGAPERSRPTTPLPRRRTPPAARSSRRVTP